MLPSCTAEDQQDGGTRRVITVRNFGRAKGRPSLVRLWEHANQREIHVGDIKVLAGQGLGEG
jgi:hypothetical protein